MKRVKIAWSRMIQISAFALAGLAITEPALSCTCLRDDSPQEHIDEVDVIFDGTAQRTVAVSAGWRWLGICWLEPCWRGQETAFSVTRTWKGEPVNTIRVRHPETINTCSVEFEDDASYRVSAFRTPDGELHTNLCTMKLDFDWSEYEALLTQQKD